MFFLSYYSFGQSYVYFYYNKFQKKTYQNNILNKTFKFGINYQPYPFYPSIDYCQIFTLSPSFKMLIFHITCLLILSLFVIAQEETSCEQNTKIIQQGNILCQIDYNQCINPIFLEIDTCTVFRCKLELGQKCYSYSYQSYNNKNCLIECCGYKISSYQSYTQQQVSECLIGRNNQNQLDASNPINKLPIILGSVLGSLFFIILITCICCRHKIKACCNSTGQQNKTRSNQRTLQDLSHKIEQNNIRFTMEKSEQNFNYNKQIECTICLRGSNELQTKCLHWFHLKCLLEWLSRNFICPNCNSKNINPAKICCIQCHKPFGQLKLDRRNELNSLKKIISNLCKNCNSLKFRN